MKKALRSFCRFHIGLPVVAILLAALLGSCQSAGKFAEFDSGVWKNDRLGCGGKRQELRRQFDKIRLELKGSTQVQVISVLGKPDFQRLYQRNQKFYIYFMEPGPQCKGKSEASQARTVVLRFSAIGLVTEVLYNTGRPY
jgi:outer membrane protein assembly factor BamE (lipoprotein component of BamABCDE complex)